MIKPLARYRKKYFKKDTNKECMKLHASNNNDVTISYKLPYTDSC